jgi:hypothetical protein
MFASHKLHRSNDALLVIIQKAKNKAFLVLVKNWWLAWLVVDWSGDAKVNIGYVVIFIFLIKMNVML